MNAPPVFAPGGNSPVVMYLRHSMIVWISVSCGERVGTVLPEPLWPTIRVSGGRNLCKKWCWRRDTLWFLAGLGQMSVFREWRACWWLPWVWQCTSRVVDSLAATPIGSRVFCRTVRQQALSDGNRERKTFMQVTSCGKVTRNWRQIATSIVFYLTF